MDTQLQSEIELTLTYGQEILNKFGCDYLDMYFTKAMTDAKSDRELYSISDIYETILSAELKRIEKKLHILRTT
jgi:hypothetical protein